METGTYNRELEAGQILAQEPLAVLSGHPDLPSSVPAPYAQEERLLIPSSQVSNNTSSLP